MLTIRETRIFRTFGSRPGAAHSKTILVLFDEVAAKAALKKSKLLDVPAKIPRSRYVPVGRNF
jgi:hypothetical protein